MREHINRLARGILTAETPELSVSPESLDGEVRSGEVLRTSVSADSENGVHLKGLVYSDDPRVQVLRASYGGVRNRIAVEVDARDLDPGEELTGTLRFVTNGGECQIPFCFRVTAGAAAGSGLASGSGASLSRAAVARSTASISLIARSLSIIYPPFWTV